ncbi:MAG: flagellar biosynthetic protein FliO [Planctomycetaceae bacterium]|nr:flagellar biosynthetic protein FliO [Planctomycetaceae bacterium]
MWHGSIRTAMHLALMLLACGGSVLAQEFRPPLAPQFDPRVQPATHVQPTNNFAQPNAGPQQIPGQPQVGAPQPAQPGPIPFGARPTSKTGSKITAPRTIRDAGSSGWFSMFMSLLVVVGLFFGTIWIIKRTLPTPAPRLPAEVVEVLGSTPLAGRQNAHLVRLGNKLLLVSVFPSGAETLTEITDPLEVDRIAGICKSQQPQSSSASFRTLLDQIGREKSPLRGREANHDV